MPKDKELAKRWKNSKIREISLSLKNFKGSTVQYAFDKDSRVYSVKVTFKGQPYILTMKAGQNSLDMLLTDLKGSIVEHVYQDGSKAGFTQK